MKQIFDTGFGWIAPTGEQLGTNSFGHIDGAIQWDVALQAIPAINELMDDVRAAQDACLDLEKREGSTNAEWHTYEMAMDDARGKIHELMMAVGFLRIGVSPGSEVMEAQGLAVAIHNRLADVRRVLKEYNIMHRKEYGFKAVPYV